MRTENFIISIYTENNLGLLNRISSVFLKRRINIESLWVTKTENKNISKFIIEINTSEDQVKKIIQQLEKQVEVMKANYNRSKINLSSSSRSNVVYEELQGARRYK